MSIIELASVVSLCIMCSTMRDIRGCQFRRHVSAQIRAACDEGVRAAAIL